MNKSMFTAADLPQMLQARAEQAFWSDKDQHLQKEMFNLNGLTRLRHLSQRASFCHDVTTDADKFEKILTPLEHRINKVTVKEYRSACNADWSNKQSKKRRHPLKTIILIMYALIPHLTILDNETKMQL